MEGRDVAGTYIFHSALQVSNDTDVLKILTRPTTPLNMPCIDLTVDWKFQPFLAGLKALQQHIQHVEMFVV